MDKTALYKKFGERLSAIRKERGLTQFDVANAMGTVQSTYSGYELGTRKVTLDIILSISKALSISPDELLSVSPTPLKTEVEELTADQRQLLNDYNKLNEDGQSTARDSVHALTFLAKYKKCYSAEFSQEA